MNVIFGTVIGGLITAPLSMCSNFNGIGAWHTLTDEERAKYGWFPAEIINESYDNLSQTRSEPPDVSFDDVKKLITVKYTLTNKLVDEIKDEFMEKLSSIRYQKEVGGVTFNGVIQSTERDKRLELSDKVSFMATSDGTTMWKSLNGWHEMGYEQLKSLNTAVGTHVDMCFKAENEAFKIIKSSTKAKLLTMDIPSLFEQAFGKLSEEQVVIT